MTTIEIVAAFLAGALYLLVLIVLRAVSRVGVQSIPRKPPRRPIEHQDEQVGEGAEESRVLEGEAE